MLNLLVVHVAALMTRIRLASCHVKAKSTWRPLLARLIAGVQAHTFNLGDRDAVLLAFLRLPSSRSKPATILLYVIWDGICMYFCMYVVTRLATGSNAYV